MIRSCTANHGLALPSSLAVILARDPSRTTMLRARFLREVNKRWRAIKGDIRRSILGQDCFALVPIGIQTLTPTGYRAFDFPTTQAKIQGFMGWLESQEAATVLDIPAGVFRANPWDGTYYQKLLTESYHKGSARARATLKAAGVDLEAMGYAGAMLQQPWGTGMLDRLTMIHSRVYEDLKTVTAVTNVQVRRLIADGLTTGLTRGIAAGKHPHTIARELLKDVNNRVDKIGRVRSRMIARSEVMRAHHVAQVAEFHRAEELIGRELEYDWVLGGGPCPSGKCPELYDGNPYKLDEIEGLQPAHPNCTCSFSPRSEAERRSR